MPTELQVLKAHMRAHGLSGVASEHADSWWKVLIGLLLDDDDGGGCTSCQTGCSPGCQPGCVNGCSGGNQNG